MGFKFIAPVQAPITLCPNGKTIAIIGPVKEVPLPDGDGLPVDLSAWEQLTFKAFRGPVAAGLDPVFTYDLLAASAPQSDGRIWINSGDVFSLLGARYGQQFPYVITGLAEAGDTEEQLVAQGILSVTYP